MTLNDFLNVLSTEPSQIAFADSMAVIDAHYDFAPARFTNGEVVNEAGTNNGSCKILAFGQLHNLSPVQTLHMFGDYYRKDVLENPQGSDHGNIRSFMSLGWDGVTFDAVPLGLKA